jgi:uncharacterized damage-inducible protein DinB
MMTQNRPGPSDYAPFYGQYVALVPDGDLLTTLANSGHEWRSLLGGLTPAQADFRYQPTKWSIKESIGHVTDTERIFTYRALRIARGDQTPLSGFEQDDYVKEGNFSERTLEDLLEEFSDVRRSTVTLLRSLPDRVWMRRGNANQKEVTVTALAFIISGHERHHRKILEERYLLALSRA